MGVFAISEDYIVKDAKATVEDIKANKVSYLTGHLSSMAKDPVKTYKNVEYFNGWRNTMGFDLQNSYNFYGGFMAGFKNN